MRIVATFLPETTHCESDNTYKTRYKSKIVSFIWNRSQASEIGNIARQRDDIDTPKSQAYKAWGRGGTSCRAIRTNFRVGTMGRGIMRRVMLTVVAIGVGCLIGFSFGSHPWTVQGQGSSGSIAAIPGAVGGQDTFGPYDVAKDWPANISTLPGNELWTWGAGQAIYAENPNRVFLLFRGELPNIKRPAAKLIPDFGPSLIFPIGRLPWRDATISALPGSGGTGQEPDDGPKNWMEGKGCGGSGCQVGTLPDHRGLLREKIIETFPQYDHLFKRPHCTSRSIPTIRRNTSGSWTITCTPSTSSRMT